MFRPLFPGNWLLNRCRDYLDEFVIYYVDANQIMKLTSSTNDPSSQYSSDR